MGIDENTGGSPLSPLYPRLPYGPKHIEREDVARHQRARLYGAMIESVHQRGYRATTVAHVIALAGVSRRAFYEQFRNKEHCFLATYDILVARERKRVIDAWNREQGWANKLHAACKALLDGVAEDPKGLRLILVEALSVGASARERMHLAGLTFERLLAAGFATAPGGAALPALASRAVVGGVRQVLFLRIVEGRERELATLTDEVIDWMESYRSPAAARLGRPSGGAIPAAPARPPFLQGKQERARALASLVDLTVEKGYACLTDALIADAAGISAEAFHRHFSDKEACFLAVLDEFAGEAMAAVQPPLDSGRSWPCAVDAAMHAFVQHLATHRPLLRIAFIDLFELGAAIVGRLTRSIEALTELLTERGPPPRRGPLLAREAVSGAIWAVIATHAVGERPARLPLLADQLTFIVLAPYIGAKAAIDAIQDAARQPDAV